MPTTPVPQEIDEFLSGPNPAVIATVRPDGAPASVATWYDWQDGRILVSMDSARSRLQHLRDDPRVSLTVLDSKTWSHVTLRGRVASLSDDERLDDIDRLARRYTGQPFEVRNSARVSAWIEVDSWHSWGFERG